MTKLKPCKKCGKQPELISKPYGITFVKHYYSCCLNYSERSATLSKAKKSWNKLMDKYNG